MTTISLRHSWPESNSVVLIFTISSGEFTQADVDAVNKANGSSDRGWRPPVNPDEYAYLRVDPRMLMAYHTTATRGSIERTAVQVIKDRYPKAQLTTTSAEIARRFPGQVERVSS